MCRLPCRLIALAVLNVLQGSGRAQSVALPPESAASQVLPTVTVYARRERPVDAGGQVARRGRIGILGDEDVMDAPFDITAYTGELIRNQQARGVGDVLLNDPAVRVARGFGNFQETYFIRGFLLASDSVSYDGLFGLLPRQYIATELFDRVEVLKGASAFLNGASPFGGAIGGLITLRPKRAADAPLTEATAGASSGSQTITSADISRRFGTEKSAGFRVAMSHRDGGTGVHVERARTDAAVLGMDWRGQGLRASLDVGYQDNRLQRTRTNVSLDAAITEVPGPPDAFVNWAQPWSFSNARDTFGALRAEMDLGASWTAWVAAGARHGNELNSIGNITLTQTSGEATSYRFDNARIDNVSTGEAGVRVQFTAGAVTHAVVLSGTAFRVDSRNAYALSSTSPQDLLRTNLYRPVDSALPAITFTGNVLSSPRTTRLAKLRGIALADTLGLSGDTLLLTAGIRYQRFDIRNFAYDSGVQDEPYEKGHASPGLGLVLRTSRSLAVYANYIESLAEGDTAPSTAANAGQQLAPYVSRQREVGLKFDGGTLLGSVAAFSTTKPRAVIDSNNVFRSAGEDRHQGVELMVFGRAVPGLNITGGFAWLAARQRETGVAGNNGKKVIGVPSAQLNLNIEWEIASLRGFTAEARVISTGHSFADDNNTLVVPGWTRIDMGSRYGVRLANREIVLRLRVDNVAGRNYWASAGGYPQAGYLVLGAPRRITFSGSIAL